MITNPNTTPVQAQTVAQSANQTVRPALTAQTAKPSAPQTKLVSSTITPTTPTRISQPQVTKPALVQKTSVTAPKVPTTTGVTAPQTVKSSAPVNSRVTAKSTPAEQVTAKQDKLTTTQITAQRPNGAQANAAMPHQGKADKNGVKFVGVETMPQENNNATTRGYAMITQVTAKSYGVDVSNYQGTDLSPYARQGAKFAIVKLTEGTGYINPYAAGQIASAKANGMLAMGYVFAHSGGNINEAKQEAEYGIAEAQRAGLPKGSYIAYDYEVGASGSIPANTAAIETFMQTVLQAGYLPLLYSGNAYLHAHVNVTKITNDYKGSLWVASYPTMGASYAPNWNYFPSNPGVAIWQFTDDWKGMHVDGDVTTLPLNGESSSTITNTTPAPSTNTGSSSNSGYKSDYHVGDQVTIDPSAKTWTNGATINHVVTNGHPYTVIQVAPGDGGAVCLKDPQTGTVMGWMNDWEVAPYSAPKQNTPSQSKPASNNNKPASQPTNNQPANNSGNKHTSGMNSQPSNSSSQSSNSQPAGGSSSTNSPDGENGKGVIRPIPNWHSQSSLPASDSGKGIRWDTTTQTAGSSEQAPTATKVPDININVSTNANAKAMANANANVNVDANTKARSSSNSVSSAKGCGLTKTTADAAVQEGLGEIASIAPAGQGAIASTTFTPSATATPVAGTIATPTAAAGRGSVAMPATGQTQGDVAAGLTAVAVSILGAAGLLDRKRQDD